MKTSKEKGEDTVLPFQALSGVGGDLKDRFKGGKEYRRVGITPSQERHHHVDERASFSTEQLISLFFMYNIHWMVFLSSG